MSIGFFSTLLYPGAFFTKIDSYSMETKQSRKNVSVIIAIVAVVLGVAGMMRRCADGRPDVVREYTKPEGDTLAVAIEMSPLTYHLRNDTADGFDYQVMRNIARRHGRAVAFYPVSNLSAAFQGLYDHKYDILVGSLPSTTALKKYFPLTDAVYFDRQVLVQRTDSAGGRGPILSQEQLVGDTVWVTEGSPYKTRLRNMSHELGDTIIIESEPDYSSEQLAILTALGEVRQAVVNKAIAERIAAYYPNLDVSTPISLSQFQVWAVSPGDSVLLDSLNSWLSEFKTTEAYRALTKKYDVE